MKHIFFSQTLLLLAFFRSASGLAGDCVPVPSCVTNQVAYDAVVIDNPFCCTTEWDSDCQAAYDLLTGTCTGACPPGQYVLGLVMYDEFGDGWNGGYFTVYDADFNQSYYSTTLASGQFGTASFCLPAGCYAYVVTGGAFPGEISWTLTGANEGNISGFAPQSGYFCVSDVPGCMDWTACNYSYWATEDDGSCVYGAFIHVYHDNDWVPGYHWAFDSNMAYYPIRDENTGNTIFTDEQGIAFLPMEQDVTGEVSVLSKGVFGPSAESMNVLIFPQCNTTYLEVISTETLFAYEYDFITSASDSFLTCSEVNTLSFRIANTGSITIDFVTFALATPANSEFDLPSWGIGPNSYGYIEDTQWAYWFFGLKPGEQKTLTIDLYSFGYTEGDVANFLYGLDINGVNDVSDAFTRIFHCNLAPNQKSASPLGLQEPHYITVDETLTYTIHYSNLSDTGAQHLMLVDIIDTALLDLSTFQPLGSDRGALKTYITPDGLAYIDMSNAFIADSGNYFNYHMGWIQFKISPKADAPEGSVIYNTAVMEFGNGYGTETNTTWHTIYDCLNLASFELTAGQLCDNSTAVFTNSNNPIFDYQWFLNEEPIGNESEVELSESVGQYVLYLMVENPNCFSEAEILVEVHPSPEASIEANGALLTASGGVSYQWYLNGSPLTGATGTTHNATLTGIYSVEAFNEFGCSDMSEGIFFTSVDEKSKSGISLFPNPMNQTATLFVGSGLHQVTVFDLYGRIVQTHDNVRDVLVLSRAQLASGMYFVVVKNDDTMHEIKLMVE